MSTDFPRLHFGVYRSPLHTLEDVKKIVNELKKLSFESTNFNLDMSLLSKGIYFIKISTENNVVVRKIIKE